MGQTSDLITLRQSNAQRTDTKPRNLKESKMTKQETKRKRKKKHNSIIRFPNERPLF